MNHDEREEIAASVAAHAELGPRYEAAVAEGLVERIGEEIDKRVDARLRGAGHPRIAAMPPMSPPPPMQAAPPAPPAPATAPQVPTHRSAGATVAGVFLALGSMGLGVGATAVVVSHLHSSLAALFMVVFIWVAIIIVNGTHARFYWPDGTPPRRRD